MGSKYSLIEQLNNPEKSSAPILPEGINYQEHNLTVDREEVKVFIPLRESSAFEAAITEHGKYLNRDDFRSLMRKHRGILDRE